MDDRRGLPVGVRLAAHVVAASVASGLLLPHAAWWSIALAVVAITWSINLYNFMDGADGMAGGMAVWLWYDSLRRRHRRSLAACACCRRSRRCCSRLPRLQPPPARIFLGDAGSVPLGFLAATMGLAGSRLGLWSWTFPALVFCPFVIDATATLMLRAARRERVWRPHRDHLYQRVVLSGMRRQTSTLWWYLAMALCAIARRFP